MGVVSASSAWRFTFAVLPVLIMTFTGSPAAAQDTREYAIKAAFLFHFTRFIEWPPEARPGPDEPFRVGVLGGDPFGNLLEEVVRDEDVDGHPIVVEYHDSAEEATGCQILFVPAEGELRDEALARFRDEPVLLVGEDLDFLRDGGAIALVREQERVAIHLSREAMEAANLSASSRLLRLARIVENPGNR